MSRTLKLLIINISGHDLTSMVEVLREGNYEPEYRHVERVKEIEQLSISDPSWDFILLSEAVTEKNFPILETVVPKGKDIPIIFFTEDNFEEVAVAVMDKGADDCITTKNPERLLPIVNRELAHRQNVEKYENKWGREISLSDIADLTTEEIYLFKFDTLKCFYTNKKAVEKSGYEKDTILGLKPNKIYSEHTLESFKELVQPLIESRRDKISICTYIERKSGATHPVETHLTRIDKDEGSFICATNKNISGPWYKIRKLKRQRSLTQKFIRKNNQRADYLANAAHDIRNSINSIILSNQLLAKKVNMNPDNGFKKYTNAIYYSANHLLNYVDEFFDRPAGETKKEDVNLELIDIKTFGERLFQVYEPVAKTSDINFQLDISGLEKKIIKTNATSLKRILKNLLSNSFKYTQQGTIIFTIYSPGQSELKDINFEAKNAVAFQVQDTGIGIPKSKQEKIFERHAQVDKNYLPKLKSSGLGLNICKQLTESLGGKLHLKSKVKIGSKFILYLPLGVATSGDNIPTSPVMENHITAPAGSFESENKIDKTILVVDDNATHNLAVKEFLNYKFESCIAAGTREETYQKLQKNSVDCIVLDYIINDSKSIEIANYLKQQKEYANIPIIIYTGKKLKHEEREELNKYAKAIVKKGNGSHKKLINAITSFV